MRRLDPGDRRHVVADVSEQIVRLPRRVGHVANGRFDVAAQGLDRFVHHADRLAHLLHQVRHLERLPPGDGAVVGNGRRGVAAGVHEQERAADEPLRLDARNRVGAHQRVQVFADAEPDAELARRAGRHLDRLDLTGAHAVHLHRARPAAAR